MSKPEQLNLFSPDQPQQETPPAIPFQIALLGLGSIRGLGLKALKALVGRYGDGLGRVLESSTEELLGALTAGQVHAASKLAVEIVNNRADLWKQGELALENLERQRAWLLGPGELPERLRSIPNDPPYWLFGQGNRTILNHRPAVAVVGTRTPSDNGLRATNTVTKVLAPYQVALISGLAQGIDEQAHQTSLATDVPNIAFLGHGIDIVFPEQTADLRTTIIRKGGAIATEYLPGEHFQKRYFVQRNRLQAGLADLVVPVEARPEGGTAHTIRFAREFKRPLVGVRWPGANGILEELEREPGLEVVDIFTEGGYRALDRMVRRLVESHNHEAYSLRVIERQLLREIHWRDTRPEDIRKLISSLEAEAQEYKDGGQGGHSGLRDSAGSE